MAFVGKTKAFCLPERIKKMKYILKNSKVYIDGQFVSKDIAITDGVVSFDGTSSQEDVCFDFSGCVIFPGFEDVHVHLREPGFSYKETIESGTKAAAAGGYTTVFAMPNLNPVPDSKEAIKKQIDIIKKDAVIKVFPYGAITVGEKGEKLAELEEMKDSAIAFSDDGRGVQSEEMMLAAMEKAKELGKIIAAHCEDNSLLRGGYIHDGEYAKINGHKGICSESEYLPIKRDIELAKKTGVKYHVCHISTAESVELIRKAKKEGVDITCETAPHYLTMNDMMLKEEGRFKMNPPIRSEKDRLALIEGIKDGTIDMIATDHAPHSEEEKSKGLSGSSMGVSGIETAFPVLYTKLVKPGIISLEKLVELMHDSPGKRFGTANPIKENVKANLTVFDLENEYIIDSDKFLSKGKSSPFDGEKVSGRCLMTFCEGKLVWEAER